MRISLPSLASAARSCVLTNRRPNPTARFIVRPGITFSDDQRIMCPGVSRASVEVGRWVLAPLALAGAVFASGRVERGGWPTPDSDRQHPTWPTSRTTLCHNPVRHAKSEKRIWERVSENRRGSLSRTAICPAARPSFPADAPYWEWRKRPLRTLTRYPMVGCMDSKPTTKRRWWIWSAIAFAGAICLFSAGVIYGSWLITSGACVPSGCRWP